MAALLRAAKQRANAKGWAFDLTAADLGDLPSHCPVLGIPMAPQEGRASPGSPSVDRIDNDRGYERGNVKIISHRANLIKGNATADELRRVADYIELYA